MNIHPLLLAAVAALTLQGCSGASTPVPQAKVQRDVSNARKQAAENNTDAVRTLASAEQDRAAAQYQARITQARGKRQIALAQCEAQSGDALKACRDHADAKFKLAEANAEADKAAHR